ncbi:MAG: hypothetical protein ABDH49_05895 [Candidatus Hydrothermales bacterium]
MPDRDHIKVLFNPLLVFILTISFIYFSGKSISEGNIRIPFSIFLFLFSAAIATSIRFGVFYLFFYIVFMAFLKRVLFAVQGFTFFEPAYLVTDVVTIVMFLVVINRYREKILAAYKKSFAFKVLLFLQIIFFVQIFNPLQGSLMIGLTGSKFLLIPSLLAYVAFGVDRRALKILFTTLTWLALVSSLYAIYQFHKGFFDFEILWAKKSGMHSLFLGDRIRPFSFFPSPNEFSLFIATVALIEIAMSSLSPGILFTLIRLFIYALASFYVNVRAGPFIFLFLFPLLIIFKISRRALPTLFLYYFVLLILINFISGTSLRDLNLKIVGVNPVYVEHFLQGIIDPAARGSSFIHRLKLWRNAFINVLKNPFGHGIGVSTLAARRFGGYALHVESTFVSMLYSCGIFGFLSLMFLVFYVSIKGFLKLVTYRHDKIMLALWIGFVSIFMGQWLVTYFQGAFFWLSMGVLLRWIDLKEEI